jgi:predicted acylesterase/phospholipase RssA
VRRARSPARSPVGLALAGGGPFGAIYEIGALMALEDSLEGIDLNALHCYVGVSAGSFLAAALANGNRVEAIYRMFIEEGQGQGALTPGIFMRPAFREYGRRARILPGLLARSAWRYFTRPFSAGSLEAFAALGRAIPTGIFDNEAIHEYLEEVFTQPGQTNDFRKLRRRLFLVATDLDSGRVVSFGRPGRDDVPISKAVQASSALPGLFPPVEIGGHHFVDGALKKTLHASEALDAGARLVICINPIVPFDARLEASRKGVARSKLVEGGLPVVLSQTFRAVIHSRMAVGMSKYESQYRDATWSSSSPTTTTPPSSSPTSSVTRRAGRSASTPTSALAPTCCNGATSCSPSSRATASACAPGASRSRRAASRPGRTPARPGG